MKFASYVADCLFSTKLRLREKVEETETERNEKKDKVNCWRALINLK